MAARNCGEGTRARSGRAECVPVGVGACPMGFVTAAYGCRAELPESCTGATRPRLSEVSCAAVGDCAAPFPPEGATLFVDPTGPSDATHFTTITAALTAAPAGATIAVERGRYVEDLTVRRPVRVIGRCAAEVEVVGTGQLWPGLWVRSARDVEVAGLTIRGHDGGLELDGGAALVARGLVVEGNTGTSVLLLQGSRLELETSVVRDTVPRNGDGGRGASIQAASTLILREVAFTGHQELGLYASGPGSTVETDGVVVLDTIKNGLGEGGDGVHVRGGAQAHLARTLIARSQTRGVVIAGAGTQVTVDGVGVDTVSFGIGVEAADEGRLVGQALDLGFARGAGLVVRSASASLSRSAIHDTRLADGADEAYGVAVYEDGVLTLRDVALTHHDTRALAVEDQGSRLEVFEGLVDDTRGDLAPGVAVLDGATFVARGLTVARSGAAGILINSGGGTAQLREVLIEGTRPIYGSAAGAGLLVSAGEVHLDDSTLRDNPSAGIVLGRSVPPLSQAHLLMRGSLIEASFRRPELGAGRAEGYGVWISTGSTLAASRSRFLDNQVAGIGVMVGASATLDDCEIFRTRPDIGGLYGEGLYTNGRVTLRRSVLRQNTSMGLQVHGPQAWAWVEDSVVSETGLQAGGILGHGVVASFDGTILLHHTLIAANPGAGVAVDSGGVHVAGSELSGNAVALEVKEGLTIVEVEAGATAEPGRLSVDADTRFLDNGTRTGLAALPLPAPLQPPE